MAADWSHLPSELLQLISQKLDNELCLLHFRSVCSTWRSSSIPNLKHKNPLPLNLPPFSQSNPFFNILNSKYTTGHLIKHTFFLIKPPQQQPSLNPWLIRIGPDVYGKPQLWHPFSSNQLLSSDFNNVLDFNKLSLRILGRMSYMHLLIGGDASFFSFYVAAVCHREHRPVIVTLKSDFSLEPMMFCCGDDSWTMIPNMPTSHGGNACVFKGWPCVVDKAGRTVMIGPDLTTHLIAEPVFGGQNKFLVESSEFELLLVDRYENYCVPVWIDVFRLDEKEKRWVKLTNLGDKALFLGNGRSFSASASELGFANGNCVIYSTSYSFHGLNIRKCKMSVFHLDQGQASPLSDYPEYFKLFWPPPAWVTDLHL
uniref:Uncharacterized protein n=1 Tax=Medicago truncatula TaxID=3880 RepID=I3SK47_MEDTR|nr:unknown [Medicago truncatula]